MPTRFSIIMTVFESWHFLPRALSCVMQQDYPHWELILAVDGPAQPGPFSPQQLVHQVRRQTAPRRVEILSLPRAEGCFGNVGRHRALDHATGDYVCWVNHDNLIAPQYLSAHARNVAESPGCLSVVDIDLWKQGRYFGRYPRRFAVNQIDLLCFAVPLATARAVNAFGGDATTVYAADWLTFDACQKLLPVKHNRQLVGTHF